MVKLLPPSPNAIQIQSGSNEASFVQPRTKSVDGTCYQRFTILIETDVEFLVSDWWVPQGEWDDRKLCREDLIFEGDQ